MPSRIFAAIYDPLMSRFTPQAVRDARESVVNGLSGDILEVGAGTGMSFAHYGAEARVTATDYSPHMVKRAERKTTQSDAEVRVQQANVEKLPFDDQQFDHTVSTLLFCSVDDPAAGLAEIRRVTKTGGSVRFLEHVRADAGKARRVQGWLTPLWLLLNDGCHLNRETVDAVERAGFEIEFLESVPNTPGLLPMKEIHARVPHA